ncbi:hypothetical protein LFADAHJC_LOCUS3536 [Methylorubrum extorquens]
MPGRDFRPADPLSARRRRERLLVWSRRLRFDPRPTSREAGRPRRGVEGGRKRLLRQSRPEPLAEADMAAALRQRAGPRRQGGVEIRIVEVADSGRNDVAAADLAVARSARRSRSKQPSPTNRAAGLTTQWLWPVNALCASTVCGSLPRNGRNRAHEAIAPAPHARLCPFPKRRGRLKGRSVLFIRLMIVVRARKRPCLDRAASWQYSAGARLAWRSTRGQPVTGGHGASLEPDPPAGRREIPRGRGSSAGRTTFG